MFSQCAKCGKITREIADSYTAGEIEHNDGKGLPEDGFIILARDLLYADAPKGRGRNGHD